MYGKMKDHLSNTLAEIIVGKAKYREGILLIFSVLIFVYRERVNHTKRGVQTVL